MDILSSLNKSLQPSWSAPNLCRNLSGPRAPQLLQGVRSTFVSYDNKVKLRILLSFLGIQREIIINNAVVIKQIMEIAAEAGQNDLWVTTVAGLVHRRLFPDQSGDEDGDYNDQQHRNRISNPVEKSMNAMFEEVFAALMDGVHKQQSKVGQTHSDHDNDSESAIISSIAAVAANAAVDAVEPSSSAAVDSLASKMIASVNGDDVLFFQPMETQYLGIFDDYSSDSISEVSKPRERHFQYVGKEPNFLEREKKRAEERHRGSSRQTFALADSIRSAAPAESRLFNNSSSRISAAAAAAAGAGQRRGVLASTTGSFVSRDQLQQRKPVQMLDLTQVKQIQKDSSSNNASLTTKADIPHTDGPLKKKSKTENTDGDAAISTTKTKTSGAGAAAGSAKVASATSDSAVAMSAATVAATATVTSPTPSVNPTAADSNTMKAPDLDLLFAESPLLTADEQETIRKFFSPEGPTLFPPDTPELKFYLQRSEKVNEAGETIVETIRLRLICSPQLYWKKSRTTKLKDKKDGDAG